MDEPTLPKLPPSTLRINPAPNASAVTAPTYMVEAFTAAQMIAAMAQAAREQKERDAALCKDRQQQILSRQSLREGDEADVHLRLIALLGCESDAIAILAQPEPQAPA